jgi:hypothetical protein
MVDIHHQGSLAQCSSGLNCKLRLALLQAVVAVVARSV